MKLVRRIKAGMFDLVVRVAPPRGVKATDLTRGHGVCPGGKGLRMNRRLRDRMRPRWLRVRRDRE